MNARRLWAPFLGPGPYVITVSVEGTVYPQQQTFVSAVGTSVPEEADMAASTNTP